MKINSLDDLQKIKLAQLEKTRQPQGIEILVGMATCGISSGAKETYEAFKEALANSSCENVRLVSVGCIGCCYAEPVVQVNMPGKEPVLYGNVKKEQVKEIVDRHIREGSPVEQLLLELKIERV